MGFLNKTLVLVSMYISNRIKTIVFNLDLAKFQKKPKICPTCWRCVRYEESLIFQVTPGLSNNLVFNDEMCSPVTISDKLTRLSCHNKVAFSAKKILKHTQLSKLMLRHCAHPEKIQQVLNFFLVQCLYPKGRD